MPTGSTPVKLFFCFREQRYDKCGLKDSKEYTQHTIFIQKIEQTSLNYIHLLTDQAL